MERLSFFKGIETCFNKGRGTNARYQFADAVQMIVIGIMTGATAMTQIAVVWANAALFQCAILAYNNRTDFI